MTGRLKTSYGKNFRLQGTDGIRRETSLSSSKDLSGLTPQQAYIEKGVITEQFMELYAYAHVRGQIASGQAKKGQGFVVGWDPRDVSGKFNEAAVNGVRKAGATALVVGIATTPLVPMFSIFKKAAGGIMVSASHNPKDQNGIKTFLAYRGMKLLPANDVELTKNILSLNYPSIAKKPLAGKRLDCVKEARELLREFLLAPENSWSEGVSFKNIVLVVDPANGSLSGIAAETFREAGFGRVIELNNKLDGNVNLFSGVADLEGCHVINSSMIVKGSGAFYRHKAVGKMFELGRRYKKEILSGKRRVCAAVFDADGDRFYRLEYHPGKDNLIILSGDETAFLQARFLMSKNPARYKGAHYINTVESDLNVGRHAEQLGCKAALSPVGDKWVLLRVALLICETRIKSLQKSGVLHKRKIDALKKKLGALRKSKVFDARRLSELENEMHFSDPSQGLDKLPFAVGSEETGHNITLGWLKGMRDESIPVFFGNGLKSALNTFSATQSLLGGKSVKSYFDQLEKPFKRGFKGTLYAYYIRKELFQNGSKVWRKVKRCISAEAKKNGYACSQLTFREDPDMLYMTLKRKKKIAAGIFVRNSGTENKIGVNLRGDQKEARRLQAMGEKLVRLLMAELKDPENHFYKLELDLLSRMAGKPFQEKDIPNPDQARVLAEMKKQGLVEPTAQGYRLTARGKWYITSD